MYHERVRIPNRFRKQIWRDKKMEMKAQIVANVAPIFVAIVPNLLHPNNVRVTYAKTSNLKMELVRFVPLYSMAIFQFMVIVTEVTFTKTQAHIVVGMRSRPHTPMGIELVSVHT
jgi:hypothetical protein